MEEATAVTVVMVPLVAHGHLSVFLHLSCHIAARSIPVHYASSATHVRQARDRLPASATSSAIYFHPLPLPPFAAPPPDPSCSTKFPSHLQPAFNAALHLKAPLAALLRCLSATSRRVVLIHDSAMSFAASADISLPNIESYVFHTVSALACLFFQWESRGKPPEPWVDDLGLPEQSFDGCFTDEFIDFIRRQHALATASSGRIINTCRAMEARFVEHLRREPSWQAQKVFAVGPLNPLLLEDDAANSRRRRHECLDWLDQQPPASVVYVSFGTTTSFSKKQIDELSAGLKSSGQQYLWVFRDADRGDIYVNDGKYSENNPSHCELKSEGLIVREWAPQLEILGHPSTSAFMSHCGWNSCSESITMGVPILAWPMHSDQPRNAMLVTDVLKVGMAVRDWNKRDEVVTSDMIKRSIERLMVGEEARELRRRAKALGEAVRRAMSDGGTSKNELNSFVAHISR